MQILDQFGFEPILFAAQIVNFLILAYIFKRFLYKPLLRVLVNREERIKKGLSDAEEAQAARIAAENSRDEMIAHAAREAEEILAQTKKAAEELREQILSEAKGNADKIIREGKHQATVEMENMERRAKGASLTIAELVLEKALGNLLSKDEKEKVMRKSIDTLKRFES